MKTKILILLAVFLCWGVAGCGDSDSHKLQEGIVLYYGDPAVDGCGWRIKIQNEIFYPQELPVKFQQDSLKIYVDYRVVSPTSYCAWTETSYPTIEILKIKK